MVILLALAAFVTAILAIVFCAVVGLAILDIRHDLRALAAQKGVPDRHAFVPARPKGAAPPLPGPAQTGR